MATNQRFNRKRWFAVPCVAVKGFDPIDINNSGVEDKSGVRTDLPPPELVSVDGLKV